MDRNRPEEKRLSLAQLTEAAGVSVRTVRYYIAEGLLPPPLGSGPASFYTPAHLQRLQVIGRLKEAYLPLKEIRRRLDGVEDAELPGLLALDEATLFDPATWQRKRPREERPETVASYAERAMRREERRPRDASPSYSRSAPPPIRPARAGERRDWAPEDMDLAEAGDSADVAFEAARPVPEVRARIAPGPTPMPRRAKPEPGSLEEAAQEAWRRIPLADGIELLVSDRAMQRNREKLDWLANWARKVFR